MISSGDYGAQLFDDLFFGRIRHDGRVGLTRHKISGRWRESASLQVKYGSHRKVDRGAASGSLDRLVRRNGGHSGASMEIAMAADIGPDLR